MLCRAVLAMPCRAVPYFAVPCCAVPCCAVLRYPFTSNLYVSHVDVDDVAAATCGLLATPGANGRYDTVHHLPGAALD